MSMSRIEKRALKVASVSVGLLTMMSVYTLHGPVLSDPIVLNVPNVVADVVCNGPANGCYRATLPDFIVLAERATDATLPHEVLHYEHPEWSECEVSTHLYQTTGLKDGYHRMGEC